ncbi:SUKH-4 family immunity protein [Streptomyces sp. NPDC003333]
MDATGLTAEEVLGKILDAFGVPDPWPVRVDWLGQLERAGVNGMPLLVANSQRAGRTRDLVLDVFDPENAPLVTEDQLPAGLTHEPTRRFLTNTGFPAVNDFLSLNTHNLAGTGFTEHTWQGTKDFKTPVQDGPSTNSAPGSAAASTETTSSKNSRPGSQASTPPQQPPAAGDTSQKPTSSTTCDHPGN